MALPLIDKQDNFEIIRDQIAAILVAEIANQMALAPTPADYKLRIFTERSNPWEQWLNSQVDKSPLVNVWYDNSNFLQKSSNISERQNAVAIFNIDCYGYGESADNPGGGHIPGDKEAALEVQRALRLIRNILMASENTYLQLRGLVWQRWPQTISTFQPELSGNPALHVVGARLSLQVSFNEFAPQYQAETLEFLAIDVKRTEDGEIVLEADYDYTAP